MAHPRRLLIVDDDPLVVEFLRSALASPAWEVATAADAMAAFLAARDLRPFLVLTDVQMPTFGSGTDMVRALRQEKATARTPVIVLTAMDLERAKRLLPGDDARLRLMRKPPEIPTLFAWIRELTGVDGRAPASPPPPASAA